MRPQRSRSNKHNFQNVLSAVHMFLFTNTPEKCEQESVNRGKKTLKTKSNEKKSPETGKDVWGGNAQKGKPRSL